MPIRLFRLSKYGKDKLCRLHFDSHCKPLPSAESPHVCATAPWAVVNQSNHMSLDQKAVQCLHYVAAAHVRAHVFLMTNVSSMRVSWTREVVAALRRHRLERPMNLDGLFQDALFWATSVSKLDLHRGSKQLVTAYVLETGKSLPHARDAYRRGRFPNRS